MKKQVFIIYSVVILSLLMACKKNKNEETPSPSSKNYRLQYYTQNTNASGLDKIGISYNNDGQVYSIRHVNASDAFISEENYEYNEKGLVVKYSDDQSQDSKDRLIVYTYNEQNLVSSQTVYSDTEGNTLNQTIYYTYDNDNNLTTLVLQKTAVAPASSYRDSTVYSGYINGRPSLKTYYHKNLISNPYTLSSKEKYTYDDRMNLIEVNHSFINDLTTFYVSEEYTYFQDSEKMVSLFQPNNIKHGADNPNAYSLNNNKDFEASHKIYKELNCTSIVTTSITLYEEYTVSGVERYDNNLFKSLITIQNKYACSNLSSSDRSELIYYYENPVEPDI